MRSSTLPAVAATLSLALSLAACSGHPDAPEVREAAPIATTKTVVAVPAAEPKKGEEAPAAKVQEPAATEKTVATEKARVDLAGELHRLDKRCTPKTPGESNLEMKAAAAESAACAVRESVRELDRTLVAEKTHDPARFHALMKEQAEHNRLADDLTFLAEELVWIDFASGVRQDGTLRGFSHLACQAEAGRERFAYARALRDGDAGAMAKRMKARAKVGKANLAALDQTKRLATERTMVPVPEKAEGEDPTGDRMSPAAFQEVFAKATDATSRTKALAASACATFPGLRDELGASCETVAEVYFAGTCALSSPTE